MSNNCTVIDSAIWNEFIQFIQQKLKEENREAEFENWISPIKVIDENSQELILESPNIFVQQYFEENYSTALQSFTDKSILFVVNENRPAEVPIVVKKRLSVVEGLCPNYLFENYIEGQENSFVKSVALGIANNPANGNFNPLVIYGGVGLGKTHLLHAIGHLANENNPEIKIKYSTTEEFLNNLKQGLQEKDIITRKNDYRSYNMLLVDDIQFLQKSVHFENEFCNLLEILIQTGQQVVISSDYPPSSLPLSKRVIDRMEGGLITQVQPPGLETRMEIIKNKVKDRIILNEDIILFIAENIVHNIRQLEGAVNKLVAYHMLTHCPMDLNTVKRLLNPMLSDRTIDVKQIVRVICSILNVKESDIYGTKRQKEISNARQVAMYLSKELIKKPLQEIAKEFKKTHSTLLHAWQKISNKRKKDNNLNQTIECLMEKICK